MRRTSKKRPTYAQDQRKIVIGFAAETHRLGSGGTITTLELLVTALLRAAAEGNIRAARLYDKLRDKLVPSPCTDTGYLVVPASMTADEWIARMLRENEYAERPDMPAGSLPDPLDKPVKQTRTDSKPPKPPSGPNLRGRLIR